MSAHAKALILVGLLTTGFPGVLLAADEVPIGKDLAAVIALQGLPCSKVVSSSQQGTDDYVASCADGNRYRVYVDADGRVVVKKLD